MAYQSIVEWFTSDTSGNHVMWSVQSLHQFPFEAVGFLFRNIIPVLQGGKEAVAKAFMHVKERMLETMPSSLIVYYSGHAIEFKGEHYFQMDSSQKQSISAHWMKQQLSQVHPSKLLVILDCCRAGAFDILPSQNRGDHMLWACCSAKETSRSIFWQGSSFTSFVVAGLKSGVQCFLHQNTVDGREQVACSLCDKLYAQCGDRTYLTMEAIEKYAFEHVIAKSRKDGVLQTPCKRGHCESNAILAYAHSEPLFYTIWFIENETIQHSVRLENIGQHMSQTRKCLLKELGGKFQSLMCICLKTIVL